MPTESTKLLMLTRQPPDGLWIPPRLQQARQEREDA
jgi:hypothetical protein